MNKQTVFIFLVGTVLTAMFYCSPKPINKDKMSSPNFTIMFYNVENLFDTIDNPNKFDDEFLPTDEKHWNTKRYKKKLKDLSRVISASDEVDLPDIVGLSEVENRRVLEDLVSSNKLKEANYGVVHEESPDVRGIDVALIYKKSSFTYLEHETIKISFDFEPETKTRDILYVKGKLPDNELLHVFVNHWSSRRKGQKESEGKRLVAAGLLKSKVNEILKSDKDAKIVIVGDFNDEPQNKSLKDILKAANSKSNKKSELYNLLYNKDLSNKGTYNYRGKWQMFDNIIVSRALLYSKKGYVVSSKEASILSKKWMMYHNNKYNSDTPNRTYGGPNYYGGISDHLPVFVELTNKN